MHSINISVYFEKHVDCQLTFNSIIWLIEANSHTQYDAAGKPALHHLNIFDVAEPQRNLTLWNYLKFATNVAVGPSNGSWSHNEPSLGWTASSCIKEKHWCEVVINMLRRCEYIARGQYVLILELWLIADRLLATAWFVTIPLLETLHN